MALDDVFNSEMNILDYFRTKCERGHSSIRHLKGAMGERADEVFSALMAGNIAQWDDRSGDTGFPPDLINDSLGVMFEFFRVTDEVTGKGSGRQREAAMRRELDDSGIMDNFDPGIPVYTSPKNVRRTYDHYLRSVQKNVSKHGDRIPVYRSNYPDYELGFFILDESDSIEGCKDLRAFGGSRYDQPYIHSPVEDFAFMETLKVLDIDYVVWFSPFKQHDDLSCGATLFTKRDLIEPGHNVVKYPSHELVSMVPSSR